MNKERAQSIVDWILREPQGHKDYSRGETIADVREAFNLLGEECPEWLAEDKESERIKEMSAVFGRAIANEIDKVILSAIYPEVKL